MNEEQKRTYWWADPDHKRLLERLNVGKTDGVFNNSRMAQAWARNYLAYNSPVIHPDNWNSAINFEGMEGELISMIVPMARSLTRQLISIVTKSQIAFDVLADNTKSTTLKTARLGRNVIKACISKQAVDIKYETMFEHSLLTAMGVLAWQWRTDKGELWTHSLEGVPQFAGDCEVFAPSIWDLRYDARINDPREWDWVEIRRKMNRWNLIAQFPQLTNFLIKVPSIQESKDSFLINMDECASDDDLIWVYHAYHRPTPALPKGRMFIYADKDTVFVDGVNVYGRLPIAIARAEPIGDSSYGVPYFSSLLGAQEMLDDTVSAIATNNSTFGVQAVKAPRSAKVNVEHIFGMNFYEYDDPTGTGAGPEPMNFTKSSPEAFKFIEMLQMFLRDLSLINNALRGDTPAGASGAAIATLTTNALEAVASASKAARFALKECLMGVIEANQRMASVQREIEVEGVGGNTSTDTFIGSDLDGVKGINIIEMNPIMHTYVGRKNEAQDLLKTGLVTNVKGYFSIIEGAPISELYENELSQEDLIKRENEDMLAGRAVFAINIDQHAQHIMKHSMLLNDQRIRKDEAMTQAVLAHILKHYELQSQIDPLMEAMISTGRSPAPGTMPMIEENEPPVSALPPGADKPEPKTARPAQPAPDKLGRQGLREVGT